MTVDAPAARRTTPLMLLVGFMAPQLALLLINIRSWTLVAGEAGAQEATAALLIAGGEVTILVLAAAAFLLCRAGRLVIRWPHALVSLIAHVAYMWMLLLNVNQAIPDTIQPWILSEGNVGRWNITLFMPGAFVSLLVLSRSAFGGMSVRMSTLIAVGSAVGTPLVWYLAVTLLQPSFLGQVPVVIGIFVGTALVVIFLGAVVRIFDEMVHRRFADASGVRHYTVAVLLGIVAPLAGLALNRSVPFPADFQSLGVYALTVVNGLVLMLHAGSPRFASARLFARCLTFPFIAYFFLVFLPFLPLSLFAILAAGLGFLMLTPLALGLFQAKVTLADFRAATARGGRPKALTLAIAGMLVVPSHFLIQAVLDKRAIDGVLSYFYAHDMAAPALSGSDIRRASAALVELRDRKRDIQLPYLSGMYNAIVFGDMVLSNSRMERMYGLLTGKALPPEPASTFGFGQRRSQRSRGGNLVAPDLDVEVEHMEHRAVAPGKSTVRLELRNNGDDRHSMFVEELRLPGGVYISGLRLKIEDEWVSGRIFDRKTALWVFQEITEVRRDPAVLVYLSPDIAELRVYPFAPRGLREVEIDFDFHAALGAKVAIGARQLDLNPSVDRQGIVNTDGGQLPPTDLVGLGYRRNPYLHFILDYSASSAFDTEHFAHAIRSVSDELGISRCRISAANVGVSEPAGGQLIDTNDAAALMARIDSIALRRVGGLWAEQAVAKAIVQASNSSASLRQVPVFVVITGRKAAHAEPLGLDAWSWLMPDMASWHLYTGSDLVTHPVHAIDAHADLVVGLKQGERLSVVPAEGTVVLDVGSDEPVQVYNPLTDVFQPVRFRDSNKMGNVNWSSWADLWSTWRRWSLNPAELEAHRGELLAMSRERGLMLPVTSYIVVESASQWEILKRKEAQALSNHSAFDFQEEQRTPEPPWWLLLAGLMAFLYWRARVENRKGKRWRNGETP